MIETTTPSALASLIDEQCYDYIDFGCGAGDSLTWSKALFGGTNGLGIDTCPKKVAKAREAGHHAIRFDIGELPSRPLVRYTTLCHFLEHVPSAKDVQTFVRRACEISREFVFIRQPFFDADGYLLQHGLKLYWSDWPHHPNAMSLLSFYRLLRNLQTEGLLETFSIHGKTRIPSARHYAIIPLHTPVNQHHYDREKHGEKDTSLEFPFPVFAETIVCISMAGTPHDRLVDAFGVDMTFFGRDADLGEH